MVTLGNGADIPGGVAGLVGGGGACPQLAGRVEQRAAKG
jgi:hypothetical protein